MFYNTYPKNLRTPVQSTRYTHNKKVATLLYVYVLRMYFVLTVWYWNIILHNVRSADYITLHYSVHNVHDPSRHSRLLDTFLL